MVKGDFVTITNGDIYKEIQDMRRKQEAYISSSTEVQSKILTQATYTNGRVTKLEGKSIGLWISNHPFQFTTYILMAVSVLKLDISTLLDKIL